MELLLWVVDAVEEACVELGMSMVITITDIAMVVVVELVVDTVDMVAANLFL